MSRSKKLTEMMDEEEARNKNYKAWSDWKDDGKPFPSDEIVKKYADKYGVEDLKTLKDDMMRLSQ